MAHERARAAKTLESRVATILLLDVFLIVMKMVRNILLMEIPGGVVCSSYALLLFFYHILALGFML